MVKRKYPPLEKLSKEQALERIREALRIDDENEHQKEIQNEKD